MSDRSQNPPTPEGEYFESGRFTGLSVLLGVIAFVALALCGAGALIDPKQFSFSWLFSFGYFFTLCAGCFFWIIVHYATDAEWTVVVRRQLENIAVLMLVLAVFFIPIFFLRHHLYEWMLLPKGEDHLLDRLRSAAADGTGEATAELVRLQRVKPRTLLMIAAGAGAFYFLLPQLAQVGSSWRAFQSAMRSGPPARIWRTAPENASTRVA